MKIGVVQQLRGKSEMREWELMHGGRTDACPRCTEAYNFVQMYELSFCTSRHAQPLRMSFQEQWVSLYIYTDGIQHHVMYIRRRRRRVRRRVGEVCEKGVKKQKFPNRMWTACTLYSLCAFRVVGFVCYSFMIFSKGKYEAQLPAFSVVFHLCSSLLVPS